MALGFQEQRLYWAVPNAIKVAGYNVVNVYRSSSENENYALLDTVTAYSGANWYNSYLDTNPNVNKDFHYLVTYYNATSAFESDYLLTYWAITPKEKRFINWTRERLPRVISDYLTDDAIRVAMDLAVRHFNSIAPGTNFSIATFPPEYENLLFLGTYYFAVLSQYLPVSIRDFSTNIAGYSLNVERGSKIKAAMDQTMGTYNSIVKNVKMNYVSRGYGMGTIQLPVSLGGSFNKNMMGVFNLFRMSL